MATSAKKKDEERAQRQAQAQLDSIQGIVRAYNEALETEKPVIYEGEELDHDALVERMQEDPLSVQVRSGWYSAGEENHQAKEFEILLCTGGPAVRIIGTLNEYSEPDHARIEYQDWFTFWEDYPLSSEQEEDILTYCRMFYFGN